MKIYIDKWCHDERGLEFIEKAKIVNKSLFKLYRIRKAYLNVLINALQHHNQIQTMNLCWSVKIYNVIINH